VQVTASGDGDPVGAQCLALTYEQDGRSYTEWSNVSFCIGSTEGDEAGCG
jgi:hypothetical protein